MSHSIQIFPGTDQIARALGGRILSLLQDADLEGRDFHLAISGGSTTRILATRSASLNRDPGLWSRAGLYWVDERCVPPDHEDSNYRLAREILLGQLSLEGNRIFRLRGEDFPGRESERYADLIQKQVPIKYGIPCFDLVLLGMGPDGHTASIFPDQMELLSSNRACEVAKHPVSGQQRITLTGNTINNADHVIFLVTGKEKARMLATVMGKGSEPARVPASCISPVHGTLDWFTDDDAARLLPGK